MKIRESEYFPISGEPNRSWVAFEDALWAAAAEMVDAGNSLPQGWRGKVNAAAWKIEGSRIKSAIANDPDSDWLKFLGNEWTSQIEPNDMKDIKWKEYKRYIRLNPPYSISHGVDEIHVTKDDVEGYSSSPGSYDDFKDFLNRRAGSTLARRAPQPRSPGPYYD